MQKNALKLLHPKLNSIYEKRFEIAILFFIGVLLAPIISSPYLSDDGIYYFLRGDAIITNRSIWSMTVDNFFYWLSRGRFFPFSSYAMPLFYYITDVRIYKLLIILSICFDVALFGIMIEKFTKSKRIKLTLMLAITLFFQVFTTYHNSLIAFEMFMQVLLALLLLIILCIQKFYERQKSVYLVWGLLLFLISLMMYEMSFAFYGIIVGVIWYYNKKAKSLIKLSALYAIPAIIVGCINIIVKLNTSVRYEGISANFDFMVICKTFVKQCAAAFPLSNYIFQKDNGILQNTFSGIIRAISLQDILVTILFFALLFLIRRRTPHTEVSIHKGKLLILSLLLYTMPAILISISTKYQNELSLGIGYLPVYLQYFGLLMVMWVMFYIIFDYIRHKINIDIWRKIAYGAAAVLFATILLLNLQNQRLYIDSTYAYWKYPKNAAQHSIALGILNHVGETDSITTISSYAWEKSSFFSEYANRKITYLPINQAEFEKEKLFLYRYHGSNVDESAFIGEIEKVDQTSASPLVYNVLAYTSNYENSYVYYETTDDENTYSNVVALSDLPMINADATGRLYLIDSDEKIVFSTVTFMKNYTPHLGFLYYEYGEGTYGVESDATGYWHWCQQTAKINLVNLQEEATPIKLYLNVSDLSEKISNLSITVNGGQASKYQYNYTGTNIILELILEPGTCVVELSTDSSQIVSPKDSRELYFKISQVKIEGA